MVQLIPVFQYSEYEDILKNIYHDSFPADERRDWNSLMQLTRHPLFTLYRISYNNETAGLITIWKWPDLFFIEHFAISNSLQGKGIGSEVINQLIRTSDTKIILEAEEPRIETAKRRVNFYERLGFHSCKEEYYQPAYMSNQKPVKMMLMGYPDQITHTEFIGIRARLYTAVYNRNII